MRKINLFLCVSFFSGAMGFAQIKKHSFGAGVSNGIMHTTSQEFPEAQGTEHPILNMKHPSERAAYNTYIFGIQGSHIKSTKKWLAWRTNLNIMVSSRYEDFPEEFEGFFIRHSQRGFFAEMGFGPMFTFQRKDFGVYLGGTFDLMYFFAHERGITRPDYEQWHFAEIPFPTVSSYLGYWQRMGNINSPWYLEIVLKRRNVTAIPSLFTDDVSGPYFYNLTVGFRYELKK